MIRCQPRTFLGLPDAELSDIKTVYSHQPGAFPVQVNIWKHAPGLETDSHGKYCHGGQKSEQRTRDKTQAAIASAYAGEKFRPHDVLADKIYDNEANSTRFIIVTNQRIFRWDADRRSAFPSRCPIASGSLVQHPVSLSFTTTSEYDQDRVSPHSRAETGSTGSSSILREI